MIFLVSLFVVSFGFIIFWGAPLVIIKQEIISDAFELMNLKKGKTVADLGCGTGRVLKYYSDRGVKAVGYELNPILYLVCKLRFLQDKNVEVYWGDYFSANFDNFDGIFVFTMDPYITKLVNKLKKYPGLKIASVGYALPRLNLIKSSKRVFLYKT